MKVFELLTMLNKPRYKVKVRDTSDLSGGMFEQGKIKVDLLNREVRDYDVYKILKTITIYLEEEKHNVT